jgi:threonine aldolase
MAVHTVSTTSNLDIDLRSDTVTRPTAGMRAAMAAAVVGDDQFGEDPTINELQSRLAALLGKEAALWLPSGTMANQVALRALTRPGDDVIVSRESHAVWHETGGGGANAGVQFTEIGTGGRFTADEFIAAAKPRDHMLYPPTTLVEVENTHNRAGGIVIDQREADRICAVARDRRIASFLDGARLWNAAATRGTTARELAAPFDVVSVALSKGLGAPAGSVLAGPRDVIRDCIRHRRMLGGAMRQVGILAAAGLYGLDHHLDRLSEDHDHARMIAARLRDNPRVSLVADPVETNIVIFSLGPGAPDAAGVIAAARARGVLVVAFGPRTVRAVTHLDVTRDQCERAASVLVDVIAG